jgi:hypothetical protein
MVVILSGASRCAALFQPASQIVARPGDERETACNWPGADGQTAGGAPYPYHQQTTLETSFSAPHDQADRA